MRINKYEDLGCKEDVRQLLHLHMEMKKHFILQNEIQKVRGKAVVIQEFDQKLRIAERLLDKVIALRNHIRQNGPSMPMDIETLQENTIDLTQNPPSCQFSLAEKKQQLRNTKIAFWFLVYLSYSCAWMAVGAGSESASVGVFFGIITCALIYIVIWLRKRIKRLRGEIEIMERKQMDSANSQKEQTSQANINTTLSKMTPRTKSKNSTRLLIDGICAFIILISLCFDWGGIAMLATAVLSIMEGMAIRHQLETIGIVLIILFIATFFSFMSGALMETILLVIAFAIMCAFFGSALYDRSLGK